ncbi:thioredoxin 1-like [Antennarius striatus]|uniref:thioredoxin 1-like n=1 Tax=Antennarius striatus TaxID=241820 RepID=UPI0035B1ABFF
MSSSGEVIVIHSEEEFKTKVLQSSSLVIVDFYAEWCGPCRQFSPVLRKAGKMFKDDVVIVKVDIDEVSTLADTYSVRSIPTVIVFQDGQIVERKEGAMPEQALTAFIQTRIGKK